MMKEAIQSLDAPAAIGTYSQAIRAGNQVFLSGQIPLDPKTMTLVTNDFKASVRQVFENLKSVCQASGGDLDAIVKLNIYLVDLNQFQIVNEVCEEYFQQPYPARAVIGVSALPKGAQIEADAVMMVL